jgi:dolichyl-phosphate-mannose-protein mannosyltransferase
VRKPRLSELGVAALFLTYALVLFHHTVFAVGGSDSSGYMNAARLLSEGHATTGIRGLERLGLGPEFAETFIPLGFSPGPRPGTMAGSYPPGLPLHMALAGRLGGWSRAPFFVSPIAALACLVLMYLLGRNFGLPPALAIAGSALLGFAPVFVFQAVQPMSDVVATAWALMAVYAACRSRARASALWAALAGAAFGVGVLVRPTNALVVVPLLLALPFRGKAWLAFGAGGVPFAAFQLAYGAAAFGSPWTTGYRSLLSEGMAVSNFPARARHYAFWTARLLSPLVALGWVAVAADRRVTLRDRCVLLTWFAAFFLFYSFYAPYEAWWYTRFLLPGYPALILGALLATRDFVVGSRAARWRVAAATVLVVLALAVELRYVTKEKLHKFYKGERIHPEACAMARRRLPGNAIVLSMQMSGALHYYTGLTYAMWNWMDAERFAVLRVSTESRGFRWYALLAPFEVAEVEKNLPGKWREIDRVGDVSLTVLLTSAPR